MRKRYKKPKITTKTKINLIGGIVPLGRQKFKVSRLKETWFDITNGVAFLARKDGYVIPVPTTKSDYDVFKKDIFTIKRAEKRARNRQRRQYWTGVGA